MYKYRSNCLKFQKTRDIKVCRFNECVLSSNYIICRHVYKLVERSRGKGGGGSGVQPPPPSRCSLYECVCLWFIFVVSFFFFNLITSLLIVNSSFSSWERERERELICQNSKLYYYSFFQNLDFFLLHCNKASFRKIWMALKRTVCSIL